MTTTIAVAGKGGTGKTTLAGLLIRRLAEDRAGPILAIDADPASNLNTVLGLPLEKTVGDVREETSEKARANLLEAGIAKRDLLDYEINSSVVEGVGVDLLAMGRPEGPGCYCAANNMLRAIIDAIADSYPWVVIDNEAGLEHLSRRTTRDVDVLLIVSDATVRGITTAGRIAALLTELKTKVGKHYLIVNRAADGLTPELERGHRRARPRPAGRAARRPAGGGVRRRRPAARRAPRRQPHERRPGARRRRPCSPRPSRQGGHRCSSSVRTSTSSRRPSRRPSRLATSGSSRSWRVQQVEAGAGILDLNIGPQKKLGHEVMPWIVEAVQEVVDVPLSLDTTNFAAMEAGLKVCKQPGHAQLGLGRPRAPRQRDAAGGQVRRPRDRPDDGRRRHPDHRRRPRRHRHGGAAAGGRGRRPAGARTSSSTRWCSP